MSIHKSLRTGGSLAKHRNVLTRAERIKILEEKGEWREETSKVWGLRKVKHIKVAAKKKAEKKEGAADATAVLPGAAAAPTAAPAAGAKPAAAAAAGAKPAAAKPAAKK
jgi:small basic protein (TIGR04137 family)